MNEKGREGGLRFTLLISFLRAGRLFLLDSGIRVQEMRIEDKFLNLLDCWGERKGLSSEI